MIVELHRDQACYVERIASGETALLAEVFATRVAAHPLELEHGETFTVGLFDDLNELPPQAAFDCVSVAVDLVRGASAMDRPLAFLLLAVVTRATNTTELPPHLDGSWSDLESAANDNACASEWRAIKRWYRRG
jgi:hypothetical protein